MCNLNQIRNHTNQVAAAVLMLHLVFIIFGFNKSHAAYLISYTAILRYLFSWELNLRNISLANGLIILKDHNLFSDTGAIQTRDLIFK